MLITPKVGRITSLFRVHVVLSNSVNRNKEGALLDHLYIQYRVILHIWQILHAHQRAAPIEEILKAWK
jgi:hypothetical protein